jgi:hypothetical protein
MNNTLEAALKYRALGWSVIPLAEGVKSHQKDFLSSHTGNDWPPKVKSNPGGLATRITTSGSLLVN